MNTVERICGWMICSCVIMAGLSAHAATVTYTLDNVILADGEQITGTFDWSFSVGDFEGGSGTFTALDIPYTTFYTFDIGNLIIDIQSSAIEISGDGSFHDAGLDISMKFLQPFTATQSASMDLGLSFFECCGNGFKDQGFQSGSIVPSTVLAGDYNGNDTVDAADYTVWRDALEAGNSVLSNDPTPGTVDESDFVYWRAHFSETLGSGSGTAATAAVPEPSTLVLLILSAAGWCLRRCRAA